MTYATVAEVEAGFRPLTEDEEIVCTALLTEAAVLINAVAPNAIAEAKKVVSCRMVRRALGVGTEGFPLGATQGSVAAGGYSQSWTNSSGGAGELYLGKTEKTLLGVGNKIGASNPYEVRCYAD